MKNKILILGLVFIMGLPSCVNFLDLEPIDGVTITKFWKNKEEVKDALMGCYASMMATGVMTDFVVWGELRGDLVKPRVSGANISVMSQFQNGDISSTMGYCDWSAIYAVINNCNTVLNFAKETKKIDESFTNELLAQYEAEAKSIRALMYFYLVRTFKDVPYVTSPSLNDNQDYRVAKSDGDDILDMIVADLKSVDRAENGTNFGVPFSYSTNVKENKGRFTVWGVKALLADIYLWKDDYENAIKQCDQIIGSGQFALFNVENTEFEYVDLYGNKSNVYYPNEGDADNMFLSLYANGNSVESILELQFGTDFGNPFYNMFNPSNGTMTANMDAITNLFTPSGLDRGWYDIRGEGVDFKQGYVWKWIGLSRSTYTFRAYDMSFSNWIFYRYADILLMKAEALCQLGKTSGDQNQLKASLELVEKVRARACAPESTDEIQDKENIGAKELEKFILNERAREFAHEGKRWYDVLRNAKRNNYENINYLEELASYAANIDKVISLHNKWKGDYNSHYLPIAESELRTNKALTQNPFYK